MDTRTRLLMAQSLRDPDNQKAFNQVNQPQPKDMSISRLYMPDNPLSAQNGLNTGYGSIDLNNRYISAQKNGSLGDGQYHAELTKNFNDDPYARLQYVLPHKNGYTSIDGQISPNDKSLFVNYKTNF